MLPLYFGPVPAAGIKELKENLFAGPILRIYDATTVTDMVRRSFARKITGAIFDFLHFIEHASRVFGRIFQSKIYLSSRYLLFIHRNGRELLVGHLIDCTKRKVLSLKFNHFDRSIAPLFIIQIINYFRIYRINTNIYFYISVPTMHSVSIRHDNT